MVGPTACPTTTRQPRPAGPPRTPRAAQPEPMPILTRCRVDEAIERHQISEFQFPLGVYPVEELEPKPGYTLDFESADGGEDAGEWEE